MLWLIMAGIGTALAGYGIFSGQYDVATMGLAGATLFVVIYHHDETWGSV